MRRARPHGRAQELDVRRPHRRIGERLVALLLQQVADDADPQQPESAERILHARHGDERTNGPQPREPPRQPRELSHGFRRGFAHHALDRDDVRAALEALHQLGQVLGLVGEVGLHQHDGVAPRILRPIAGGPQQRLDGARVADVGARSDHGERHHLPVRLERLAGAVGAGVVVDDDLVLARVILEHLADAPEQHAHGRGFVVRGNAEIEHGISSKRVFNSRRTPVRLATGGTADEAGTPWLGAADSSPVDVSRRAVVRRS